MALDDGSGGTGAVVGRTRPVMAAVLGGLRTGCGPQDRRVKGSAGQAA